ncbi:UNVERIFIED_CONTAM: hypothetical protein Sradi_4546900 [Sesamum radiatum]|uniref:DUF4216 domain-containing protein n=1 Tax=Sesamum radiatum TaxID=300843 RepID=A0AAW2NCY9_SESRA
MSMRGSILMIICNCPELELDEHRPNIMPKAVYTLENEQKRRVCEYIRGLKFPDGYASNLARCVDMTELWMHGMKSHDCHVFMQKLIPIAFREILPKHVRSALTEYFEPDVQSKRSMPRRNDECTSSNDGFQVSTFNYTRRASGATKRRWLSGLERYIIEMYNLTNCEVVTPYYESYLNKLYQHQHPAVPIIDRLVSTEFKDWFKLRVHPELNYTDKELLKCHYWGRSAETLVPTYFINEYNFPTEHHNTDKSTMNCGCRWVDLVRDMKVHPSYHLIDVNFKKLYQKDDPFILAQQAVQVYFMEYPNEDEDSGGDNETDDEEYEVT